MRLWMMSCSLVPVSTQTGLDVRIHLVEGDRGISTNDGKTIVIIYMDQDDEEGIIWIGTQSILFKSTYVAERDICLKCLR